MSWVIQHILRNKDNIRSACNLESNEYDDLLTIESKIEELHREGFLSDMDVFIVNLVSDGKPIRELEKSLSKNRITISKTFIQICNRIAYFLGGYFTDDGFVENMRTQYKLSDPDIEKMKNYMSGKFKHKLMRKINGK